MLIQHGGYYTLGVNTCVMTLPALFSFALFRATHRIPWIKSPSARGLLVGFGAAIWFLSGAYSLTLVSNTSLTELDDGALELANARLLDPWILAGALLFVAGAIDMERQLG